MGYGPALESDKLAREWLAEHNHAFGHFINGKFLVTAKRTIASLEPATGKKLAKISLGSTKDVDQAVKVAKKAQASWYALGSAKRARHLYALARMVQRNARLFAVLESLDNGKAIRESRDIDIPLVARHFYYHAGWAQLQESQFQSYRPVGVVGQIIPWNFPLLMLAWKVAPALAAGNCVVLKPAEQTSLTALLFAQLASQAGLPDGVLNIVTGDGTTGKHLSSHVGINKLAFTGSTEVGRSLRVTTAGTEKSLTLELGGKSPFIVFDDADLDAAVEGIVDGVWFNQGQVCCAGSRLLAHESIIDKLHKKLIARLGKMRVGLPLDKNTDVGAIISPLQLKRIKSFVAQGIKDGAGLHQSKVSNTGTKGKGCFFPPTLLANIQPSSKAAIEEIFGPVLVSMSFRTPDEAVELANNSRYGLAASIYSETIGLALDIAPKLAAGVIWVNSTNLFDAAVGFGGYRESGFGREGGIEGMFEYLKPKDWDTRKSRKKISVYKPKTVSTTDIDRTAKNYIGGKQKRPDGGYSYAIASPSKKFIGEVARGNRKDIRDAVEAAVAASSWSTLTAFNRAQILYFMAENLSARQQEFAQRIRNMTECSAVVANKEVGTAINRLFTYAAWADKFEGTVHEPPLRGIALAMNEPVGIVGVICPAQPSLLGLISLCAPLIATGNRVIVLPSEVFPLVATDFYQVLETSDLPNGVINIVTGLHEELVPTLAGHLQVDGIWAFSDAKTSKQVEVASAQNIKRVFTDYGKSLDWQTDSAEGKYFLHHAVQVKNIWIPYGE